MTTARPAGVSGWVAGGVAGGLLLLGGLAWQLRRRAAR